MSFIEQDRSKAGAETAMQDSSDHKRGDTASSILSAAPPCLEPTELLVILQRRRDLDQSKDRIVFTGFDICHPDGRPVSVNTNAFCQQGTRLLLGRARRIDRSRIRIRLFPVAERDADLTRVGRGVRCRRFYALRRGDEIRFHFSDGTPTEMVFQDRLDDRVVLDWLRANQIQPGIPFWFDLACELEDNSVSVHWSRVTGVKRGAEVRSIARG